MSDTGLTGKYDAVRYNINAYLTVVNSSRRISILDIAYIDISNAYITSLMPEILCKIVINKSDFIAIQKEKLKLSIKMDEYIANKTPEIKETIFEKEFRVTDMNASEHTSYSGMRIDNQASDNDIPSSEPTATVILALIDLEFISKYRTLSSAIFKPIGLNSIIAYEFEKRKIKSLYTPTDNREKVSRSFPVMNMLAILQTIDRKWGLYKDMPMLFYNDIDRTYLINQYNPVFEKDEIENVNIIISDPVEGDVEEGSLVDKTGYIINTVTIPTIYELEHVNEFIDCNNLLVSNPSTLEIKTVNFANEEESVDRILSSINPFVSKWVENRVKETLSLKFAFDGIYLDAIKPNKRYVVVNSTKIEDQNGTEFLVNKGVYRALNSHLHIQKDSEDSYKVTASVGLSRIE